MVNNSDAYIRATYQAAYLPVPPQTLHALGEKDARGLVYANRIQTLQQPRNLIAHEHAQFLARNETGEKRLQTITRVQNDLLRTVNAAEPKFAITAPLRLRESAPVENLGRTSVKSMANSVSKIRKIDDEAVAFDDDTAVNGLETEFADVQQRLYRRGVVEEDVDEAIRGAKEQIAAYRNPLAASSEIFANAVRVPERGPFEVKKKKASLQGPVARSAAQRDGLPPTSVPPSAAMPPPSTPGSMASSPAMSVPVRSSYPSMASTPLGSASPAATPYASPPSTPSASQTPSQMSSRTASVMPTRPPSPVFEPTADPFVEYAAAPQAAAGPESPEIAAEAVPQRVRPESPLGEPLRMSSGAGPSQSAPSPGASLQGTRPPSPVAARTTFNPLDVDVDSDADYAAAEERRKRREGKQRAKAVRTQREQEREAQLQQAEGRAQAAMERLNDAESARRELREDRDRVLRELDRTRADKSMSDAAREDAEASARSQLELRDEMIRRKEAEVAAAANIANEATQFVRDMQAELARKESERTSLMVALQQERERSQGMESILRQAQEETARRVGQENERAKRFEQEISQLQDQVFEVKSQKGSMEDMEQYVNEKDAEIQRLKDQVRVLQETSLAESSEKMAAQSRVQELEQTVETAKEVVEALATESDLVESQIVLERAERRAQSVRSSQQTMLYVESRHREREELLRRTREAEYAAVMAQQTAEYAQVRQVFQGGDKSVFKITMMEAEDDIVEPDDEVLEEMALIQTAADVIEAESEESEEVEIIFPQKGMDALLQPSAPIPELTKEQQLSMAGKRTLSQPRRSRPQRKKAAGSGN